MFNSRFDVILPHKKSTWTDLDDMRWQDRALHYSTSRGKKNCQYLLHMDPCGLIQMNVHVLCICNNT